MKRLLPWIVLLFFVLHAGAQTITGRVYRAGTDTLIKGATVYYGGSMGGTSTDEKGHFILPAKQRQIPIIISCVGYYSATENSYEPAKPLVVYLKPKQNQLQEVVIRADGMNRKDEIRLFIREFLGVSTYASSCTITNMDDISFFYRKKTQTFTASSDKPIIIENKKLGYTISYYLDKFEIKGKEVFISGNYIFKEDEAVANLAKIKNNREDAYDGSKMEFIRALWHGTLRKAGFKMYIDGYEPLMEKNVVARDSLQQKYIHLPKEISIINNNNAREVNTLRADSDFVFIDKDGYYGPGLFWAGALAHQRVGDLLPFDYQSEKDQKDFAAAETLSAQLAIADKKPRPDTAGKAKGGITSNNEPTKQSGAKIALPDAPVKYQLIFEKTYLHTDRDVYTRGDTLWFKAYLLNAQDNHPTESSGNLRVDLISPNAKIIASELIRLDKGMGTGDFDLHDTIRPGKYRLRAYTNWMRNFGDNFVFEKEITVLNSGGVAAGLSSNNGKKVAGGKVAVAVASGTAKNTATVTNNTATTTLPLLTFYPEGGSLVEGLSSFVAVKAEDGFGKGIPASGAVISSSGDTVANFICDTLGMGLFALLPVKGQTYHAQADLAKRKAQVFQLPSALSTGLAMQVRQTDSLIRVVVSSSTDPASLAVKPNYKITVKHSGITVINQLQPSVQQTVVKIPTAGLPEGINALTLYDENNKPNCERLVYIHHPGNNPINIATNKKSYQSKEKVTAQINTKPNANLSMAVVDAGLSPVQTEDIVSYLMLQSEIKGNIEHASTYFDTTNVNRAKQLNLLLMTQGWRDFVWRRLADTAIRISYAAENGINVAGKVRDEVNNKGMPGLNLNLYADGAKGDKIFATKSDSAGRFNFTGMLLYGTQNVKLSSVNDKGEKRGAFRVDSVFPMPVKPNVLKVSPKAVAEDSALVTTIQKRTDDLKKANINGITRLKEVTIKAKGDAVLLRGAGMLTTYGPDQLFNITPNDDKFKTLEWYLLQNCKGAQEATYDLNTRHPPSPPPPGWPDPMRKITGVVFNGLDTFRYVVPSLGAPGARYRSQIKPLPPLLVVNGQELNMDDYTQAETYRDIYFKMPINKFKKIVLKHVTGTLHGIQSVEVQIMQGHTDMNPHAAMDPDAETVTVDRYILYLTLIDDAMTDNPGSLSVDVDGYYQARTFYQPPPNAKTSITDFRTTIHWQPLIKTNEKGKATVSFYNGSGASDARIIVEGITADGVPLSSTIEYTVK